MQETGQNGRFDSFLLNIREPVARLALFVVYFWFGILKILGVSPATQLVMDLQQKTLPFLSFQQFLVLFSAYEMLIGIMFLFPRLTKLAVTLLLVHIVMTMGPLVLLPEVTWGNALAPTLEGQYILKNFITLSLAMFIWTTRPSGRSSR